MNWCWNPVGMSFAQPCILQIGPRLERKECFLPRPKVPSDCYTIHLQALYLLRGDLFFHLVCLRRCLFVNPAWVLYRLSKGWLYRMISKNWQIDIEKLVSHSNLHLGVSFNGLDCQKSPFKPPPLLPSIFLSKSLQIIVVWITKFSKLGFQSYLSHCYHNTNEVCVS